MGICDISRTGGRVESRTDMRRNTPLAGKAETVKPDNCAEEGSKGLVESEQCCFTKFSSTLRDSQ